MATAPKITADQQNATKQGLSAAVTVLPHEDQEQFETLLVKPTTEHETFPVKQMASPAAPFAAAPTPQRRRPGVSHEIAPATKRTQSTWPLATALATSH